MATHLSQRVIPQAEDPQVIKPVGSFEWSDGSDFIII